jgi:hypothetical protein
MRVEFYLLLLAVAAGLAIVRGTPGERWIAATVLAGNLLTLIVVRAGARTFASVSLLYFGVDACLAIVLCTIAVFYPTWVSVLVSAFQINGVFGHLVKIVAPNTIPFSYAFLLRVWAWPMVIAMLSGRFLPGLSRTLTRRNWPLPARAARPDPGEP